MQSLGQATPQYERIYLVECYVMNETKMFLSCQKIFVTKINQMVFWSKRTYVFVEQINDSEIHI